MGLHIGYKCKCQQNLVNSSCIQVDRPGITEFFGDDWMTDKLSSEGISQIPDSYHAWRDGNEYLDVTGFLKEGILRGNPSARTRAYPWPLCGPPTSRKTTGNPLGKR